MRRHVLLTIAVPTYNRCDKLEELGKRFLMPVSKLPGIEVLVCDNSEDEEAERNARVFSGSSVRYQKNLCNVGFHGNLLKCINSASGDWLWIISDDDEVDVLEFLRLFSALSDNGFDRCNGILLPFYLEKAKGRLAAVNKNEGWEVEETILDFVLRTERVPFILFSSVVVYTKNLKNTESLSDIIDRYPGNDYAQVFLFSRIIGSDGCIRSWEKPIQTYRQAYEGRFPLKSLVRSMEEVMEFMAIELNVDEVIIKKMRRKYMNGWAIWYVRHRAGEVKIQDADEARFFLFKRSLFSANFRAIALLSLVTFLPKIIFRHAWARFSS